MGQQQLLLIVLGTIIVGVSVVVGINMFGTASVNAERDALIQDINSLGSSAAAYWRKPTALGGGGRTFVGASFKVIGFDSSNANGTYAFGTATATNLPVTATGAGDSVVITATITKDGAGQPTVAYMP